MLGSFVELDRLVFDEPFDVFLNERIEPFFRRHLKDDRHYLIRRLAGDALVSCLRLPSLRDVHRNRWLVLGDVDRFCRSEAGEQKRKGEGSDGNGDFPAK